VATLAAAPPYIKELGMYTNPARAELIKQLKEANETIELLDLRPQLALMRVIKQPTELAALQEAIDITIKGLKYVQKHQYAHEYEIEAALTNNFRKAGAQGHGFTPIVSAGAHACVLHQEENNGSVGARDLLTLDVGAEVDHYTADITRTYSQSKNPTKRQKAVHAAVLAVQDYAFTLIKPGAFIKENEQLVEHYMGEKLRELGLIKTIDKESVRTYFPHATSHFLGLDAHDTGDYSRPLEPGMVLTVEPGIYIPKEGIGVRIEDDVLVTPKGNKILSARLPRDIS
jgi:Xaa-Pro aminopeptidase